jgi:LacI family gluconate utilization system Gnt-I transcriptional repressor
LKHEGNPEAAVASLRKSRASGRVTLDDVALSAGVSRITASRALRGERSVGKALVVKVEAAAQALGYVPDPAARALASARSHIVVVLIPLLSNSLFVDLLEAVHRTLHPAGYQILIGVTHYLAAEEEALLSSYLAHRPAGILVTGTDRTLRSQELIARSGVPCVHMMEISDDPTLHCVGFSQSDASSALTQHLLDQGRRRIAFAGAQLDRRVLQRLDGYRQAMRNAGLHDAALEWLSPLPSSLALGGEMLVAGLQRQPDVDAVFFCNDDLAQGGLLAAARQGLAVPQRVAVAGFNDLAGSAQMWPTLTTVRTPRAAIGESAATMLLQRMRDEPVDVTSLDMGWQLVVREST